MHITKDNISFTDYRLKEKSDEFVIQLFESLSFEEVQDLFKYYDTNSNVSIGQLNTATSLINKQLLELKTNELLEWNPHVYGDAWHLTELGSDVVNVLLNVYDKKHLESVIYSNEVLKKYITSVFQNHGSISLYLTSDIFCGYLQINRETKKIISTEVPVAHSTNDLPKLISRLSELNNLLTLIQNELNNLNFKTFTENYKEQK